jgi:hypothetical protein
VFGVFCLFHLFSSFFISFHQFAKVLGQINFKTKIDLCNEQLFGVGRWFSIGRWWKHGVGIAHVVMGKEDRILVTQ